MLRVCRACQGECSELMWSKKKLARSSDMGRRSRSDDGVVRETFPLVKTYENEAAGSWLTFTLTGKLDV
jgi:hypothetical protein